jgi:ubiquinone/menaquinone biosynthesis C-methylase UbiE
MKDLIKRVTPPPLLDAARSVRNALRPAASGAAPAQPGFDPTGKTQGLDVYWSAEMAQTLEVWGQGSTWDEIQCLFAGRTGDVLDVACGTGVNMIDLEKNPGLNVTGIDISDTLIEKAAQKGIARDRLIVGDATKLPFDDNRFDFSYSIGSLEHFTVEGLEKTIAEMARVTRNMSCHMMPTSRDGVDQGWMRTNQDFWNNSVGWWVKLFSPHFSRVMTMRSKWEDNLSLGMWFVCVR